MREMGALILGRLLTRPDMATPLADFIAWSKGALNCTDAVQAPFLVPGTVCVFVCLTCLVLVHIFTLCIHALFLFPPVVQQQD